MDLVLRMEKVRYGVWWTKNRRSFLPDVFDDKEVINLK